MLCWWGGEEGRSIQADHQKQSAVSLDFKRRECRGYLREVQIYFEEDRKTIDRPNKNIGFPKNVVLPSSKARMPECFLPRSVINIVYSILPPLSLSLSVSPTLWYLRLRLFLVFRQLAARAVRLVSFPQGAHVLRHPGGEAGHALRRHGGQHGGVQHHSYHVSVVLFTS